MSKFFSTVQTAKQSCELLLKIIDSILDYSKLEASALKLEAVPFLVEDVVADCVELLLPLVCSYFHFILLAYSLGFIKAAKKLDLSFDIAPDVPVWALGDYSRIRQGTKVENRGTKPHPFHSYNESTWKCFKVYGIRLSSDNLYG